MPTKLRVLTVLIGISVLLSFAGGSLFAGGLWTLLLVLLLKGKEGARGIMLVLFWISLIGGAVSLAQGVFGIFRTTSQVLESELYVDVLSSGIADGVIGLFQVGIAVFAIRTLGSVEVRNWLFNRSVGGFIEHSDETS